MKFQSLESPLCKRVSSIRLSTASHSRSLMTAMTQRASSACISLVQIVHHFTPKVTQPISLLINYDSLVMWKLRKKMLYEIGNSKFHTPWMKCASHFIPPKMFTCAFLRVYCTVCQDCERTSKNRSRTYQMLGESPRSDTFNIVCIQYHALVVMKGKLG